VIEVFRRRRPEAPPPVTIDLPCGCRFVPAVGRWQPVWWSLGCTDHPMWQEVEELDVDGSIDEIEALP